MTDATAGGSRATAHGKGLRPTAQTKKPDALSSHPAFLFSLENLVGRVGFEPTTNWLKANCSTD